MSDYNIPVSGGVNGLNVPLHGHIAVYNKEFPVIPNPDGEVTGYVTKLGFTPEILQVKDPEVHDWARAEEKPTYTKAEVGLGNVDNTSDLNKPISTATQTALDGKVDKVPGKALSTNDYTDTDKAIVDGVTSALATKVDKIAGKGLSSNDYTDYEKTKLAYIQSGAEVNVQVDWFESNRWSDAFILNKPTKLSDFSNDTGFITSTVDNLTYYYKKSETYTQAEVNALIGSIVTISFLVVQTLPQTGEANIIYLVPAEDPNPDNIYEEYIYVNNNWEMIGTTKVDLSNYYTKTETDTLLNGKVDKDGDKVLSDNNYSDTDKTKLDGIEAEANKTVVDTEISATSTNPVESKAIYNLLNDLLPEATATGNPILITNASGLNAKSLKVELEPIQDLNGYDSPWVGGGGKNKFNIRAFIDNSPVKQRCSVSIASDDTVTVISTQTGGAWIGFAVNVGGTLPTGTFTIPAKAGDKFAPSGIAVYFYECDDNDEVLSFTQTNIGSYYTVTDSNCKKLAFRIVFGSMTVGDSLSFKEQIEVGETATSYAPYSNICPISGRTQTVVSVNSEDTTIPFNQTVYGGEVDVTSGGTSDEWQKIVLNGNESWGYYRSDGSTQINSFTCKPFGDIIPKEAWSGTSVNNAISDRLTVSGGAVYNHNGLAFAIDGNSNLMISLETTLANLSSYLSSNPITICYKKATPTTISTPSNEISLNKGANTLVADGDMELVYSKTPQ